jgi:hypothetical protein
MKPKPPRHTRVAEQARDLRFQAAWSDEEEDRVSAPDLR